MIRVHEGDRWKVTLRRASEEKVPWQNVEIFTFELAGGSEVPLGRECKRPRLVAANPSDREGKRLS